MRTILHILTQPEDELVRALVASQRALPDTAVQVVELPADHTADYAGLVEEIFAADSVEVW